MAKKFIIAPYAMHKNLLRFFRKSDPFADIKIIDKSNFLTSYYGEVETQAIKEIMVSENVTDDIANKIVRTIPFVDSGSANKKINFLYQVKQKITSLGYFKKDTYLTLLYAGKSVDVYGYSSLDKELITPLSSLGCKVNFHFNDVVKSGLQISQFSTIYEEVFSCLNDIAAILDLGVKPEEIYIYCGDPNYSYYLDKFKKYFGFNVNIQQYRSYFSQNFVCELLKDYREHRDLKKVKEYLNSMEISEENKNALNNIIEEASEERLPFESQYQYLLSLLKSRYLPEEVYHPSINFINEPIMVNDVHVFVLGFHEGIFPSSFKDSDYLTDQQKNMIGLNTSLEKGKISSQTLTNFFAQDNNYHFSYAQRHADLHYYPSPFAKIWNMEIVESKLPKTYYSKKYAEMVLASLSDQNKFYHEESEDYLALKKIAPIPYDSYDNQFTGAEVFNSSINLKHSYSKMKTYYACPFQYYLSFGLKLDPFDGNFNSALGNLAHHIFQDMYRGSFNFEASYQTAIKKSDYQFSIEEHVLLLQLKKDMQKAVKVVLLHESKMSSHKTYTEQYISIPIDEKTIVEGYVDKIIITDNQEMFLFDYKTGKEAFSPGLVEYGSSFQLPTYALLTSQSPLFKDYVLSGLFIHHVLPDSINRSEKEGDLIPGYLKLDGYIIDDVNVIHRFDDTFGVPGEESSFIKSLKLTTKNEFYKYSRVQSHQSLISFGESALKLFVEGNKKIRENAFPVRPLFLDKEGACKYCAFKDICYVKHEQRVFAKDVIPEENIDNGI